MESNEKHPFWERHSGVRLPRIVSPSEGALLIVLVALAFIAAIVYVQFVYYGLFLCLVALSLFTPGFVILRRFASERLSVEESMITSFALSTAIYSATSVIIYVAGIPKWTATLFLIGTTTISLIAFFKRKMHLDLLAVDRNGFFVGAMMLLASLSYVAFPLVTWRYNAGPTADIFHSLHAKVQNLAGWPSGDNGISYRVAQFVANRLDIRSVPFIDVWGVNFFWRTPLVGLVTSFYFQALGISVPTDLLWRVPPLEQGVSYQIFQITGSFLNTLVVPAAYLVLRKLFRVRVALVSLAFLAFNPFLFMNIFYTQTKDFVGYFVLLGIYFLIEKRAQYLSGFLLALAYLAHDGALVYVIGLVVFAAIKRWRKWVVSLIFTLAAAVIPWQMLGWFGFGQVNRFFFYPFSPGGIPAVPSVATAAFWKTPLYMLGWIRIVTAYLLLVPFQFERFAPTPSVLVSVGLSTLLTIPGAMGLALFPFAYYSLARCWKYRRDEILCFMVLPVLMIILYTGWPGGLVALSFAQAMVPLLVGYGVTSIADERKIILPVYGISVATYFAYLRWAYPDNLFALVSSAKDYLAVVATGFLLCFMLLYGFEILRRG